MTPEAARVTALRLGNAILRPVAFLRDEARFGAAFLPLLFLAGLFLAVLERFADALRALLFRAGPLLPALLRAGLDLGHYVSFSGMVTFRNWTLDDAVRAVPLDRLLLETDGPYLAPVPMRGKRNEPAFVRYTAARIAEVRGLDVQELINTTDQNAGRIFGPRLN